MKTITIECRKFEEWDKETRKIILDKQRDIHIDGVDWYDYLFEYWGDDLSQRGFIDPDIAFSGFGNQGDGASFTGGLDIKTYLNKSKDFKWLTYLVNNSVLEPTLDIERRNSRYVHERSVNFYWDWGSPEPLENYSEIKKLIERFETHVEGTYIGLCKTIYKELEDLYDNLRSDEMISETLIENEFEFDKNGKIW